MFVAVSATLLLYGGIIWEIAILVACAAALVIFGMFDDKHGLSVRLRILVQVLVAAVVIDSADGMIIHLGALSGSDIRLGAFALPVSIIAYVGGVNAMNMIDGADGMAGKMALISLLGVAVIARLRGMKA